MQTFRKLPTNNPNKNAPRGITHRLCHSLYAATMIAVPGVKQSDNTQSLCHYSSELGCRTLVGFKGVGVLIVNSIFPLADSNPAHINPHPSQKS